MKSESHEQWKKYFESADCSIYEIIHNAIKVAALDDPKKFRLRRDQITEKLYSCQLSGRCCGDRMDHQPYVENTNITTFKDEKNECAKSRLDVDGDADDLEVHGERGTDKVEDHEHNDGQIISLEQNNRYSIRETVAFTDMDRLEGNADDLDVLDERGADEVDERVEHYKLQTFSFDQTSNYSMEETEALNDKIDDEHDTISHILEIKELLENNENETETEIKDSLQMLRLLVLSVEDLEVTNIGTTVSDLQQHWSRKVIQLATKITDCFKRMIQERIDENTDLSERTKGPDPPTVRDEDVILFNTPMDEEVPIGNIPPGEFTTYFEELDDDGIPKISYEIEKIHESQRNCPTKNKTEMKLLLTGGGSASISANSLQKEKQESIEKFINPKNSRPSHKSCEVEMIQEGQRNPPTENKRKLELLLREDLEPIPTKKRQKLARQESNKKLTNQINSRRSDSGYSSQRFAKQRVQIDVDNDREIHKEDKHAVHQRSNAGLRHLCGSSDETAMDEKLETSKRRLHQGYQAHERARRNTQYVAEFYDIPKEECSRRSSRFRYSYQSWRW